MVDAEKINLEQVPARAGRREWLGLAALLVPLMFVLLDNNIIFLALPSLTASLGATSTEALWIADIYGFFLTGFLITMGRVADRVGHRRLLLIGAAAFIVLSVAAAFADSVAMLILLRALLGIAGGIIGPSVFATVKRLFPDPRQLATALSISTTSAMIGISLGPSVGGVLLNWFWPGSVFLIAVPVMLWLLVVGPFVLPESTERSPHPLDLASSVLWLAAVLPFIYGMTTLARNGWSPLPAAALVVGLATGTIFVRRQMHLPNPLLDIDLLRTRAIGGTLTMYVLTGVVMSGNGLVLNQHLQLVQGYSPLATALWVAVPVVVGIIGVHVSTILAKRTRPVFVLGPGLLIAAVGEVVLTRISVAHGLVPLVVGLTIVWIGTSPIGVLSSQLVLHATPRSQAGAAGALSGTGGELSSALGIAAFGSLVTTFYTGHVQVPATVPAGDAVIANESISHAVAVAHHLPAGAAADLLATARDAFTGAVTSIAGFCVVLFVAIAALVFTILRAVPPIGGRRTPAKKPD
jgi:MFS transporter, DHA2 family, multidrug resistance protein